MITRKSKTIILMSILCFVSCASMKKLPQERYYEFIYVFNREVTHDTVSFYLKNPLQCPIQVKLRKDTLHPHIDSLFGHITLAALQDTVIRVKYPDFDQTHRSRYTVRYGDVRRKIEKNTIAYPFPKNKEYRIIQAYHGNFTHNTVYSQYAIDFDLKIGDTITSADRGYVVGMIEDYKDYGTSQEWLKNDRSNYLTLYHPHSGIFTQYVHLVYKGSLVQLGDYVEKGQAIGICGMTGFTTTPHLHFNVKIPTEEYGLISTKIEFDSGVRGEDLKIKDQVKW